MKEPATIKIGGQDLSIRNHRRYSNYILLILLILFTQSCLSTADFQRGAEEYRRKRNQQKDYEIYQRYDASLIQERNQIIYAFRANPDTDAWFTQRQQMAQALGSRDYDVNFSRAFDSLMLAMNTLELPVYNMERRSGFLIAGGKALTPTRADAIYKEMVKDWATYNGYDPSCFDTPIRSNFGKQSDIGQRMLNMGTTRNRTITFQLVKLQEDRTRVKARIANIYYPQEIEIYYEQIWQAIDKQIFIDKNIEGESVEKRL